jgi:RimJ/RimL family protein N-acetyltransferase
VLILTDGPPLKVAALAARIARNGVAYLDARSLHLDFAAVRSHLSAASDEVTAWLVTLPNDTTPGAFAARTRRHKERVLLATALNAGDLGTLLADGQPVSDAPTDLPLIETERLVLRCPTPPQIDGYYQAILGSAIFDTILWDGPSGPDELHQWWHGNRQCMLDGPQEALRFAVVDKVTDQYIGGVDLRPIGRDPEQIDLGYAFAPKAHGKGFATEAVGALVETAFTDRGAERIIATAFVGNVASRRVVEKLGFVCEGVLRAAVRKRGVMLDEWMLAITRSDWEARR